MTFAQIEAEGVDAWLASLREELALRTYRPAPVRRGLIARPTAVIQRKNPKTPEDC
jgi:hypothetical protein